MLFTLLHGARSRFHLLQRYMLPALFSCAILSGCSSASASSSIPVGQVAIPNAAASAIARTPVHSGTNKIAPTQDTAPQAVMVQLSYSLLAQANSTESVAQRKLQYVSASNTRLTTTVTPLGGSASVYGPNACTTASCAVTFTALPGPTTIDFVLADGSNNVLSRFSTTVIIQPATLNTLKFSANPVLNSVTVNLASTSLNAGTATDDVLTITPKDIDGNTIVGNSNFVDANGNAVTLTLNLANVAAGGNGGTTFRGQTRITAPNQAAMSLHYDGGWLASSIVSLSSSSSLPGGSTAATMTTIPNVNSYLANAFSNTYDIGNIVTGPDGKIWYTEMQANAIGKISLSGGYTQYSSGLTASAGLEGITLGPDGNVWFAEATANKIGRITVNGAITEFSTGLTASSQPQGITAGPDGNLWFTELNANKIGRITPTGKITEYPITAGTGPYNITRGPDGNLWFSVELSGNFVGRITPQGVVTEYTIPSGNPSFGITSGPDGRIWFTEAASYGTTGGGVGAVTTSGIVSEVSMPAYAFCAQNGIVTGPDGNLWITGYQCGDLERITPSGTVTQQFVGNGANGASNLILAPDGSLWFPDYGSEYLDQFVF